MVSGATLSCLEHQAFWQSCCGWIVSKKNYSTCCIFFLVLGWGGRWRAGLLILGGLIDFDCALSEHEEMRGFNCAWAWFGKGAEEGGGGGGWGGGFVIDLGDLQA